MALTVFGRLAATIAGVLLVGAVTTAAAGDRTTFRGCVTERTDTAITLVTGSDERVTIETGWLERAALEGALVDCVTVTAVAVDGRLVAESIESGDEPNEVNAVTNETTADRENRAKQRNERERDDKNR